MINDEWEKSDSIKSQQLLYCKEQLDQTKLSVDKLNSTIRIQRNILTGTVVGSTLIVLMCLLVN